MRGPAQETSPWGKEQDIIRWGEGPGASRMAVRWVSSLGGARSFSQQSHGVIACHVASGKPLFTPERERATWCLTVIRK